MASLASAPVSNRLTNDERFRIRVAAANGNVVVTLGNAGPDDTHLAGRIVAKDDGIVASPSQDGPVRDAEVPVTVQPRSCLADGEKTANTYVRSGAIWGIPA